ncbi:MAG TPA: VWA domain-containing protein [Candidatus Sulfotelmatobacter sp.]|nr:VWA domain-containing protein [Candidatus Sulfotelmatobacter sp.]
MLASVLFRTRLLLAAALVVGTVGSQRNAASSQTPAGRDAPQSEGSGLVIRQSVRRVIVDVVVSDSNGQPVSGLTADDFSVAEDGKPQRIRSFDIHDFDVISESLPKRPAFLPPNTFVNVPSGPERGPLYVLLLDILDMSVDDQPVAREQLMKFIRSKPLGTRFAIFVLSDGLYLVQGFTEDRNALADAVNPKNPRSHIPRIFLYADNFQPYYSATRALTGIAKFLADLPGHKNVIWLSASFQSAVMPGSDPTVEGLSASEEIKEATDTLARGQIAVYPVDVRGVVVTHVSSQPGTMGPGMGMVTNSDSTDLNASYLTERGIADATGGRAFYGTNDVAGALTEATETGGHYYTLTYSPSNQKYDGRLRHIHVELAKRGYQLAYRRSYYGNPSTAEPEPSRSLRAAADLEPLQVARPADSLFPNMQHGAPVAHQLLFRAHIHALAPPAKATAEQMASLADQPAYFRERRRDHPAKPLRPIQLQTYEIDYTVAARYPTLELAAAAFDADGKILNAVVQRVAEDGAPLSSETAHEAIYRMQQQFDVPVSAVSLRVAVRDVATDNVGALEVNLPLAPEGQTTNAALQPASPSSDAVDAATPH